MIFKKIFTTALALQKFAGKLAKCCVDETTIIFLQGDLGVGKTTFARGFLRGLGYLGQVKSPTYTLVESYQTDFIPVQHFDLYRLHHPDELEHLGIRDFFVEKTIGLIEWPEQGKNFLPAPDLICSLEFVEKGRALEIQARSSRGMIIISHLYS